jgi:hypothetical protein
MAKVSLAEHMKEARPEAELPEQAGPFITISRQFGCYGFSLGLLLLEILTEDDEQAAAWKIYHKEILASLATETSMAANLLERERRAKPRLMVNFFRSLKKERVPSGLEIRNRITTIIRGLATEGHAIIIGQGGAGATRDLPMGLSIRLEAPYDWRVRQVAFREGVSDTKAKLRIQEMEKERAYLRKLYAAKNERHTPFSVVYDCSAFSLTQIAQQMVYAMRLRKMI